MPKIMKSLNTISRCQAAYRNARLPELSAYYHTFVFAVCREGGRSQEDISREIAINKSTAARALSRLEEMGYITRKPNPNDKRELLIYPTEKMTDILPRVRSVSAEWNSLISSEISDEEMAVFESVIARMEKSAREAARKPNEEDR